MPASLAAPRKAAYQGGMRRHVRGVRPLLVAALVLMARLIAPAAAMPVAADPWAGAALCAAAGSPHDPSPHAPAPHDCLQCSNCHLAAQPAWDVPGGPGLQIPWPRLTPAAVPPVRARGPPFLSQRTAQPTGPPAISV